MSAAPSGGGPRTGAPDTGAGTSGTGRWDGGASAPRNAEHVGIAAAIADISERASTLVREEIELAKVEVTEKATRLAKGAVVGVVAGVFFLTALFFVLVGCAWLLYYYLPIGDQFTYFWGFFAMALILVILGVIAGLIALRAVKRGAPPTPDLAIEEARRIRETVAGSEAAPLAAAAATQPGAPAPYGATAPHAEPYGATPQHVEPPAPPSDAGGAA